MVRGNFTDTWSKTGKDIPRLSMLFPTQYDVGVDNNGFKPVSFKKEVFKPGQKMSRKAAVEVNLQKRFESTDCICLKMPRIRK